MRKISPRMAFFPSNRLQISWDFAFESDIMRPMPAAEQKSDKPKTVAVVNFKGGVGKTTVTWCLGDVLAAYSRRNILLFDLDAQMSLTQAISLDMWDGSVNQNFEKWRRSAVDNKRTIYDVLLRFLNPKNGAFDFTPDDDFVHRLKKSPAVYDFVPSKEDLYWLELERQDPEKGRGFIDRLVGKIANSPNLPKYDFILFDCPPSFTMLSYSVMSSCDMILIPVNPDFFAADGVGLLIQGLAMKVESSRRPKIGVFMNRVGCSFRKKSGRLVPFRMAQAYMDGVCVRCMTEAIQQEQSIVFFDSWIPARAGIAKAISTRQVPSEWAPAFQNLWMEIEGALK